MFKINPTYILLFLLYCLTLVLIYNVPKEDDYYYRADEGTYYRQAKALKEQGLSHIHQLVAEFNSNQNHEQVAPHPLRLGHLFLAILAISIHDHISSLSYLSIAFYFLLVFTVFRFTKKWYGIKTGFIIASLMSFSPLLCGLSERALADVDYSFFQILCLFFWFDFLQSDSKKTGIQFAICLTLTLLFKEASLVFFPFYLLTYLYKKHYLNQPTASLLKMFAVCCIPVIFVSLFIVTILGFDATVNFIKQFNSALNTPDPYLTNFQSGPWYVYLLDLILLSPFTTLIGLLFFGYWMYNKNQFKTINTYLIIFFVYFLFCFSIFPKDIRFGLPIETVTRIFAGFMIYQFSQLLPLKNLHKNIAIGILLLFLAWSDLNNYYEYFIVNKIYDPSSIYLLKVKRIIP